MAKQTVVKKYTRAQIVIFLARYGVLILTRLCLTFTNHLGNVGDIMYQNEVGDFDFRCIEQYGSVWRINDVLGVSCPLIFGEIVMLNPSFLGRTPYGG